MPVKRKVATRVNKMGFGSGAKGGRKPAAIEMKAKEFMLACINGAPGVEKLVKKIYKQALQGNYKQQELLLNYILGKPVDRLVIEANNSIPESVSPVIKIIAEATRVNRLEQDIKERTHDLARIKEAEVVVEAAMGAVPGGSGDSIAQELEQRLKKA